ncbi:MAG: hypothetical protein QOJ99_2223 [Bryobacterales bacterium]|nr:hypothetical protein [Bryobacterales bacterium]
MPFLTFPGMLSSHCGAVLATRCQSVTCRFIRPGNGSRSERPNALHIPVIIPVRQSIGMFEVHVEPNSTFRSGTNPGHESMELRIVSPLPRQFRDKRLRCFSRFNKSINFAESRNLRRRATRFGLVQSGVGLDSRLLSRRNFDRAILRGSLHSRNQPVTSSMEVLNDIAMAVLSGASSDYDVAHGHDCHCCWCRVCWIVGGGWPSGRWPPCWRSGLRSGATGWRYGSSTGCALAFPSRAACRLALVLVCGSLVAPVSLLAWV